MNKVLIIEDDKDLSEALTEKLTASNFEVSAAFDGEEGAKRAFAEQPDAIILDLILPGSKDGITVLEEIRADGWGANVPILILTNMNDMEHISKAVEHESSDYIIKADTSLDEIVSRLKERMHL